MLFLLPPLLIWELDTSVAKKRKADYPKRSVKKPLDQVDRSSQRIVTLDVYHTFKTNPEVLLARRLSESLDSESEKKVKPTCKLLPTFLTASVDFDLYRNTKGAPLVSWKGAQPLQITPSFKSYSSLTDEEIRTCATLRILPIQYLEIKKTMLLAVQSYGPFKKREAQTWFRIDICIIFDWFKELGWIPDSDTWNTTKVVVPKRSRKR